MKKCIIFGVLVTSTILLGGGMTYMVLAQTSSTQVTACARPNGEIYLIGPDFSRQNCSGQQVEISWPTLLGTPKQFHLFDGNDQDLGIIFSASGQATPLNSYTVYLPSEDLLVDYGIDSGEIISANISSIPGPVYYSSVGCTGQSFVSVSEQGFGYASPQNLIAAGSRLFRKNAQSSTSSTALSRLQQSGCTDLSVPEVILAHSLTEYSSSPILMNPAWPLRVVQTQF